MGNYCTLIWLFAVGIASAAAAAGQQSELECMFLGYPDLEFDGFDRTEVGDWKLGITKRYSQFN
jgi:hypothetical protein